LSNKIAQAPLSGMLSLVAADEYGRSTSASIRSLFRYRTIRNKLPEKKFDERER
jgi:hypothetical protein